MLKLELNEQKAKITAVNPRAELHGEDKKPACDVKVELNLQNDALAMFHPALRSMLYAKSDAGDLADQGSDASALRFPQLSLPLKWDDEIIGAAVTIHYGATERSHLHLSGCVISKPQIEPLEGGTVVITCLIQCHPDEKQMGRLGMMVGTEIPITIVPPEPEEDMLTSGEPVFTAETLQE